MKNLKRLRLLFNMMPFNEFFNLLYHYFIKKDLKEFDHHLYTELIVYLHQIDNHQTIVMKDNLNVLNLLENQQKITIELRRNTSDFFIFNQIFIRRDYNDLIKIIFKSRIAEDIQTVIDVGANIGCAALYFHTQFPNAKIICIEPEESNLVQINQNLQLNSLANIQVIKGALWIEDTHLQIENNFRDKSHSAFTVNNIDKPANLPITQGFTLDTIINNYNLTSIDLLKIDIEGAESHLFKKQSFLNNLLKVKFLALEVHEEFIEEKEIIQILDSIGFVTTQSGEYLIGINQNNKS